MASAALSNILNSEINGFFHPLFYKYKVCCVNGREIFVHLEYCRWQSLIQKSERSKISKVFPLRHEKDLLPWLSFRSAGNSVSLFIPSLFIKNACVFICAYYTYLHRESIMVQHAKSLSENQFFMGIKSSHSKSYQAKCWHIFVMLDIETFLTMMSNHHIGNF